MTELKCDFKTYKYLENRYDLGFDTDFQYMEYIEESLINGQKQQAMNLFHLMDNKRREMFIEYCNDLALLRMVLEAYIREEPAPMKVIHHNENDGVMYNLVLNDQ